MKDINFSNIPMEDINYSYRVYVSPKMVTEKDNIMLSAGTHMIHNQSQ